MRKNIFVNKPYLVYSNDRSNSEDISTIGVYFITDKQLVFRTSKVKEEDGNHPAIIKDIDSKIYENNEIDSDTNRRIYNAYIYLYKHNYRGDMQFLISFPENGYISLGQYIFLSKTLMELNDFNVYQCLSGDKCKYISILIGSKEYYELNINDAMGIIKRCFIGYQELHQEKIIGEVLNEDELSRIIKYYVDFSRCININDLNNIMLICEKYYNDSYYHDSFIRVFPNYLNVYNLVNEINKLDIDNIVVGDLSLENVYDVLSGIYDEYKYGKVTSNNMMK